MHPPKPSSSVHLSFNAGYIRKSSPKSAYIIGDFFGQNGLRIGGLMLGGGYPGRSTSSILSVYGYDAHVGVSTTGNCDVTKNPRQKKSQYFTGIK